MPEAASVLTGKGELRASGGWMIGLSNELRQHSEIDLAIAAISPMVKDLTFLEGDRICYFVIPSFGAKSLVQKSTCYSKYWIEIKKKFAPDVVHIHGTEFSHGLSYVEACGAEKVAVSIQGLTSVYERYFYAGLSTWTLIKTITLRDLIAGTMFKERREMAQRGEFEKELLRKVSYVMGRTEWDRAHTWALNPDAKYYFCNETLRPEFYSGEWSYSDCEPHSIFLSQAYYSIKGFHQVLKALPIVIRHYPDAIVKIAGGYPPKDNPKGIRESGYSHIIRKLIESNNLQGHIKVLGNLNAQQMKDEMLKSNVFVCPSSIENSPNSLGEAQILGVPNICSFVGGARDMMEGNEENLYRFEEVEMMAYKICKIFENKEKQIDMSNVARMRHDPQTNGNRVVDIYREINESQRT